MGLICHVDLFPVPSNDSPDAAADPKRRTDPTQTSPSRASTSTLSPTSYSPAAAQQYPYTYPAPQPPGSYPSAVQPPPPPPPPPQPPAPMHPSHIPPQAQEPQYAIPNPGATRPEEIVYYFKNTYPVTEGSKQTEALAGTTFVQAANLDYKGNKVLMFVFSVRVLLVQLLRARRILLKRARRTSRSRRRETLYCATGALICSRAWRPRTARRPYGRNATAVHSASTLQKNSQDCARRPTLQRCAAAAHTPHLTF